MSTEADLRLRLRKIGMVQESYRNFADFLHDGMQFLGFEATEIQESIGEWMSHGPRWLMVQAQRSQAKTTVAALFAVWCLIHRPGYRVLIVSAAGAQATEISTLVTKIITTWDILEDMRPDKAAGDRSSVSAFDLHGSLKGVEKSPSVACVGIDSNLQGKRADLLIVDDAESAKNSATAVQRAKLSHTIKDFASIVGSTGRILFLGTPQTLDSVYNTLPSQGVAVRIWPGRYPTDEQLAFYKGRLSPLIVDRIQRDPGLQSGGGVLGDQGKPVDAVLLNEEKLQSIEAFQGTPFFQLQHMLNTTLSDRLRYPLKAHQLVSFRAAGDKFPLSVTRGMLDTHLKDISISSDCTFKVSLASSVSPEVSSLQQRVVTIDPAAGGANGDETAAVAGGFLNGNVYLLGVKGTPGGYSEPVLEELARWVAGHKPDVVVIEKNMGYGAFAAVFTPILRRFTQCGIKEDLVVGQKEKRLINTLAPIIGRGALIVDESVFEQDREEIQQYGASVRIQYSLFHQLTKVTMERGALVHDDRLDSLEAMCRHFNESLALDQSKKVEALKAAEWAKQMQDPLGHHTTNPHGHKRNSASMLRHRRR